MLALRNRFFGAAAALAMLTPTVGPLTGHAAEQTQYGFDKAAVEAGGIALDAGEYSQHNPVVAIYVLRGDEDKGQLSNEKLREIMDAKLGETAKEHNVNLPTEYFFANDGNEGQSRITFYVAGLDVQVDLNGDGKDNPGESSYYLGRSVDPTIKEAVVLAFKANYPELAANTTATRNVASLDREP